MRVRATHQTVVAALVYPKLGTALIFLKTRHYRDAAGVKVSNKHQCYQKVDSHNNLRPTELYNEPL